MARTPQPGMERPLKCVLGGGHRSAGERREHRRQTQTKINGIALDTKTYTAKGTFNRVKRQPTVGENICKSYLAGEGRRSKRTRNFYPSIAKIPNNRITKWAKDPNKHFSEGIQMANSFMERCISLTITITNRQANADQKHEDRSPIPVRVATISRCWGRERRTGPLVCC